MFYAFIWGIKLWGIWGMLCIWDTQHRISDLFRKHFEKEKTLFVGLYIIWIISQKQQQLCLILLHRTKLK